MIHETELLAVVFRVLQSVETGRIIFVLFLYIQGSLYTLSSPYFPFYSAVLFWKHLVMLRRSTTTTPVDLESLFSFTFHNREASKVERSVTVSLSTRYF